MSVSLPVHMVSTYPETIGKSSLQSARHWASGLREVELGSAEPVAEETSEAVSLVLSWARAKAARPRVATVVKKRILLVTPR
jgi:hypothetical protein